MDLLCVFVLIPASILFVLKFHKFLNRFIFLSLFVFGVLLFLGKEHDGIKLAFASILLYLITLHNERKAEKVIEEESEKRKNLFQKSEK